MIPNWDELTPGEQFIMGWQYKCGLGSFKTALAETVSMADENNRNRLALGFPEEVEAFRKFACEESWWPEVQKKAGITK